MVNVPPTVAWWFELKVCALPYWRPVESIRMTPANALSFARPVRWMEIPLMVTAAPELFVRVNVVNGTRVAFIGASELAGCEPEVTVTPAPVGTVVPVPVVVVWPAQIALALARLRGPQ